MSQQWMGTPGRSTACSSFPSAMAKLCNGFQLKGEVTMAWRRSLLWVMLSNAIALLSRSRQP
jgi:hypothetical protein